MVEHAPDAPIGVFDSGIGGLTVVAEIIRQLPSERILYFGDTARLPYGPKSPETVLRYSREISGFLLEAGVKALVVACNTATAHALPALIAELPIPVIGVIEPGAQAAVRVAEGKTIGVIGTRGTIASGAYVAAISAVDSSVHVVGQPCPLFVPLVEEGWLEGGAAEIIAREYMKPLLAADIRTLVLGCTHYPLLKPLLRHVLGPQVQLIDSAEETAAQIRELLRSRNLLSAREAPPSHRFIASDAPRQFLEVGQRFLGSAIDDVETVLPG
jgi:glutamate racemase